jgi:hypothetical protein
MCIVFNPVDNCRKYMVLKWAGWTDWTGLSKVRVSTGQSMLSGVVVWACVVSCIKLFDKLTCTKQEPHRCCLEKPKCAVLVCMPWCVYMHVCAYVLDEMKASSKPHAARRSEVRHIDMHTVCKQVCVTVCTSPGLII